MIPSLTCYPSAGKKKALAVCQAFALGAKGKVAPPGHDRLENGPAFFYGWWPHHTAPLIERCKAEGREWFYADNAYHFGYGAEIRITRGALMHDGRPSEATRRGYEKMERHGVAFRPWQKRGRHVVIACQTEEFYRARLGTTRAAWADGIAAAIVASTGRAIRVVEKPARPSEGGAAGPLLAALDGAWALVTHSSMAGVAAICAGVPVWSDAAAFSWVGLPLARLGSIESPSYPDDRERWLATLLANQWTIDEIASGKAWRELHE